MTKNGKISTLFDVSVLFNNVRELLADLLNAQLDLRQSKGGLEIVSYTNNCRYEANAAYSGRTSEADFIALPAQMGDSGRKTCCLALW